MSSTVSDVTGSWHSSGYYGHDRSKAYNECAQLYRRLATPGPPSLFNTRSQLPRSTHAFSEHDSRRSLSCGPIYFEHNIGRRRNSVLQSGDRRQRDFLTWVPDNSAGKRTGSDQSDASLSSYTVDYRGVQVELPQTSQRLVKHLRNSVEEEKKTPVSTYRKVHCSLYPQLLDASKLPYTSSSVGMNKVDTNVSGLLEPSNDSTLQTEVVKATTQLQTNHWSRNQDANHLSYDTASFINLKQTTRSRKPRTEINRESVARCMVWYQAPTAKPAATQTEGETRKEAIDQKSQVSFPESVNLGNQPGMGLRGESCSVSVESIIPLAAEDKNISMPQIVAL